MTTAPETAEATDGMLPARACSLLALIPEWDAAVAKKWKEARDSKGHWIAIYSPQWFKDRGHQVECQIMADGESIGIREANAASERLAPRQVRLEKEGA